MSDNVVKPISTSSPTLMLNAAGGDATISREYLLGGLKRGANTVWVDIVPPGTSPANVDLSETGRTAMGTLSLQQVDVPPVPTGFAAGLLSAVREQRTKLVVDAARVDVPAHATVTAAWPAEVVLNHRVNIGSDGKAEVTTMATITNRSDEELKNVNAVIVVGDTQNRPKSMGKAAAVFEAAPGSPLGGGSRITSNNPTTKKFALEQPLSLAGKATTSVNLYGKEFAVPYKRDLTLRSSGTYARRDSLTSEAGSVDSIYRIANTHEDGIGYPLPAGPVTIKSADGTLLSQTSIGNTAVGKTLELEGGTAFDVTANRQQTSFSVEPVSEKSLSQDRVEVKELVRVGQKITFSNAGSSDEEVRLVEQGVWGDNVTIEAASVNGVAKSGVEFAKNGTVTVEGIKVPAKGEGDVSFDVVFTRTRMEYRPQR